MEPREFGRERMSRTKRQHFVPQCYLDRFSTDGRLWVFDKFTRKEYESAPLNVAQERYFYDIPAELLAKVSPDKRVDPQFLEKALSRMEGEYNRQLGEILRDVEHRGITREQRVALAPYIVFQLLRTKESREDWQQLCEQTTKV